LVYRGQDSRQVLQEPWEAIHPDDRNEYMMVWQKSLRTGQQMQQKVRLLRFDGNYRWFYVRAAPLKDKRQNIVHWIGTNMDFHDQHLAELNSARQQETAASEAKYRALANSSPQIVFAVTRSSGVIFCNTQWTSYSGQTEAEACGLGFMDFVHPEDISKCRLPSFDAASGAATNVPTTVPPEPRPEPKRADSISSASDVSSETEKLVTSPEDDSPASIKLPQARLSKLASAGIIKVTKDADGRPSYSTEVRLRSKDGNYRWHLVRILLAAPVLKDPNEEETWYGTCTDINDHKLLEQRLKETMDAKSRFLSNMSHEIRTPLNGITGMVNFLIDSSLTSEQLEHVNIIRHSTEGLRNLIDDILDLSKVEAGMITLSLSWFHVRSLIEEVNDLMSAMAINKGLELNHVVDDEVPSMMRGDRFRLRQILLNVVGNAIKFTSQGEVFVRCRIADAKDATDVGEHEQMLQFDVIDSGSGFTEKEAEYLFKRFSQIDGSTTKQQGGTGLGLAISMQLTELHGGKMRASSVPGKGSTFTFTIKFQLPSEENFPPSEDSRPGSALPSRSSSTRLPFDAKPSIDVVKKLASAFGTPIPEQGVQSPSSIHTEASRNSPALSTGSSEPSINTNQTSVRSERSSASSYVPEPSLTTGATLNLNLPPEGRHARQTSDDSIVSGSDASTSTAQAESRQVSPIRGVLQPPLYSILVVCPLEYSRLATVRHIEATLPKSIPHQITARASIQECQEMLGGDDPVIFTHVILVLHEPEQNIDFMNRVLRSSSHSSTAVLIISDLAQKREIMRRAPDYEYEKLSRDSRLAFIFKPLKPSKFSMYFDPQKERAISMDRNQDSAQAVAVSQKAVFDDLKRRLGNKGHRVLLVEDNQINQTVSISLDMLPASLYKYANGPV
jgi:signal transduction histidine kinase